MTIKKKTTIIAATIISGAAALHAQNHPNVVVVMADDLMYQDIGCYGSKDAITPNIDKWASEGMRFTNFHQATAMSSPTRNCIMTGLYPFRSGAYPNHTRVYKGTKSIAHHFHNMGYRVAQQGKRHIGPRESYPYEYLGKDNEDYNEKLIEGFIKDATSKSQPFCLWFCSHNPHGPWNKGNPAQWDPNKITLPPYLVDTKVTREKYCQYLAEIEELDKEVGQLDALLEKYGLKDNTIILFTSEQGHSFPFAKWTCYGAGLQTAVIMRYPKLIPAGATTNAMCEYVDVVPTLIDFAGGEVPDTLDGRSYKEVAMGKAKKFKKYTYGEHTTRGIIKGSDHYGIRSVSDGKFRFIWNLSPEEKFTNGVTAAKGKNAIWGSWLRKAKQENDKFAAKQVKRYQIRPKEELYLLTDDPYEMNNVIDNPKYKKTAKRLRKVLRQWMKEQGDLGTETELRAFERMPGHCKDVK